MASSHRKKKKKKKEKINYVPSAVRLKGRLVPQNWLGFSENIDSVEKLVFRIWA